MTTRDELEAIQASQQRIRRARLTCEILAEARRSPTKPTPAPALAPKPDPATFAAAVAGARRLADQAAFARMAARAAPDAEAKPRTNEQIVKAAKAFDVNSVKLTPDQKDFLKGAPWIDVPRYKLELLRDATRSIGLSASLTVAAQFAGVDLIVVRAVVAERDVDVEHQKQLP